MSRAILPAPSEPQHGTRPEGRTVLRNAMVIDGTGAPPYGPATIVLERGRIRSITSPIGSIAAGHEDAAEDTGTTTLDLAGAYVLPGLIDSHAHIGTVDQVAGSEYPFKLWMGHGITTIREAGALDIGLDFVAGESRRSHRGEIVAPHIEPYVVFGQGAPDGLLEVPQLSNWMREVAERGARGVKFFGAPPHVLQAAIHEARRWGLRTMCHHSQTHVAGANAVDTAQWGLDSLEHGYGLPEALFTDRAVQRFPAHYNYLDEHDRFSELGRSWAQAAAPGSTRWQEVIERLVEAGLTLVPTFVAHLAARDVEHATGRSCHAEYTTARLAHFFTPGNGHHGSFFFDWGTAQEVAWRENYRLWMQFVGDFHRAGGRVCAGSDAGFIYNVFGFGLIEEMELLCEAGLSPLEAISAATLKCAELLGVAEETGSLEPGKRADLLVVQENPLANLKVLNGTGHRRYNSLGESSQTGGVRQVIKDGVLFDAARLRAEVRTMVAEERANTAAERPGSHDA